MSWYSETVAQSGCLGFTPRGVKGVSDLLSPGSQSDQECPIATGIVTNSSNNHSAQQGSCREGCLGLPPVPFSSLCFDHVIPTSGMSRTDHNIDADLRKP